MPSGRQGLARRGALAFQLLSSLALFVAATFQAVSQRPSLLSACFLALFGAERMATSVAPVTQHALLTRTQTAIWRRALVLSMFAIAGECVVQALYVSLGPDWPKSAAGSTALRWLGFAELTGGGAYLADFTPFFILACVASAQLFLHRVAAAEVAALTIGLPGTRVGAHATEAAVASALAAAESGRGVGVDQSTPRWAPPTAWALALVAGASVPSFAAAPYLACAVFALGAWGFVSHEPLTPLARRRRRKRTAAARGAERLVRRRGLVQAEARVRGVAVARVGRAVRRRVRGGALRAAVRVPAAGADGDGERGAGAVAGAVRVGRRRGVGQLFSSARRRRAWRVCSGAYARPARCDRRGGTRTPDVDETESEMSETPRSARSGGTGASGAGGRSSVGAGFVKKSVFAWPPWRRNADADAGDDLDEPLLRGEGSSVHSGLSDLSDVDDDDELDAYGQTGDEDDSDGAGLRDDLTPTNDTPMNVPDVETRLFARFAGVACRGGLRRGVPRVQVRDGLPRFIVRLGCDGFSAFALEL
jgi:hypothetical protein